MKGFLLAGISSGIGKTTVSMGLMNLIQEVSPFKSGPDFIDPTFHKFVTGNPSYNLDLFLMGEEGVKYSFYNHCKEFAIVEGAMGLYDGIDNNLDNFSAAHLSRVLNLPVILVIDGEGKGTSIASQVLGYKNFDSRVNIMGVIINRVSSRKTYELHKNAIERYTGIKCLGYLEKNPDFNIASRHLGLLQAEEIKGLRDKIQLISESMRKTVNIEYIKNNCKLNTASSADIFRNYEDRYKGVKIGIARDKAFSFYYEDNLELLEKMGVEIIEFSPIQDNTVPDVDFLYFGGGYPEIYLAELSSNLQMISSIQNLHQSGKVILGECGGFMYLSEGVEDLHGKLKKLCGLADCTIQVGKKLDISRFGYVNILLDGKKGKAHEFHYSKIKEAGRMERKYEVSKPDGRKWPCGYSDKNFIGGYPHLHFFGSMDILTELLEKARKNYEA